MTGTCFEYYGKITEELLQRLKTYGIITVTEEETEEIPMIM